jgi:hypothetical protein
LYGEIIVIVNSLLHRMISLFTLSLCAVAVSASATIPQCLEQRNHVAGYRYRARYCNLPK